MFVYNWPTVIDVSVPNELNLKGCFKYMYGPTLLAGHCADNRLQPQICDQASDCMDADFRGKISRNST